MKHRKLFTRLVDLKLVVHNITSYLCLSSKCGTEVSETVMSMSAMQMGCMQHDGV